MSWKNYLEMVDQPQEDNTDDNEAEYGDPEELNQSEYVGEDFEDDQVQQQHNKNKTKDEHGYLNVEKALQTRPKSHLPYSKQQLQEAVTAVKAGSTYSKASRQFQVPRQTIRNHVTGKSSKPNGKQPVLNEKTEAELTKWVTECAVLEDPRTPRQFLKAAGKLAALESSSSLFKNRTPTRMFIKSFMKRNPGVKFRKPQSLTRASANVTHSNVKSNIQQIKQSTSTVTNSCRCLGSSHTVQSINQAQTFQVKELWCNDFRRDNQEAAGNNEQQSKGD